MRIMSSKNILAQLVDIAYGHIEEGPSADEICLEISRITSRSVETLDHMNVEISKR
jgi:hypothetical protein